MDYLHADDMHLRICLAVHLILFPLVSICIYETNALKVLAFNTIWSECLSLLKAASVESADTRGKES